MGSIVVHYMSEVSLEVSQSGWVCGLQMVQHTKMGCVSTFGFERGSMSDTIKWYTKTSDPEVPFWGSNLGWYLGPMDGGYEVVYVV